MKQMSLSEMVTYSTVKINCKDSFGNCSSGTGFIMSFHATELIVPVIITNNHVVCDCVETSFEFCKADNDGNPIDVEPFTVTINNGNAWRRHPDKSIDLCFLPLQSILDEIAKQSGKVFFIPLDSNIIADDSFLSSLCAIEEIVMVGYPQGLMDAYNHKPIVRKGITVTHPKNNYMGKPEILFDIAAYPGSSGSPIFVLNEGSFYEGNTLQIGSRIKLIGVLYGGPQFNATGEIVFSKLPGRPVPVLSLPCNLGIAIKAEKIREMEEYVKQVLDQKNLMS